ncbi:peptidase S8/S53 domain-containing protein [Mycena galericulata]|nr:peptidase S8/S53 domain-containing protein [Mycena galericulata]
MRVAVYFYLLASLCLAGYAVPLTAQPSDLPWCDEPDPSSSAIQPSSTVSGCPAIPTSTIASVQDEVPDTYMVQFNAKADMNAHIQQLQSFVNSYANCSKIKNSITDQFNQTFLKFYAGTFDGKALQFISTSPGVLGIERSAVVDVPSPTIVPVDTDDTDDATNGTLSQRRTGAPWNLQRITQDGRLTQGNNLIPFKKKKNTETTLDWNYNIKDGVNGNGVVVYVVDGGVQESHPELAGRVQSPPPEYIPPIVGPNLDDLDGHGTNVASIITGATAGVANAAEIISMKVRGPPTTLANGTVIPGKIFTDTMALGIGLATAHFINIRGRKGSAIISMSLSTTRNGLLANTIDEAVSNGIHVVLSAGNNGKDECATRVVDQGQITVGATNINDKKSSFSNFGNCVDVYGPGTSILAAQPNQQQARSRGTSYAAPHVAGMIAAILSSLPSGQTMSPLEMKDKIIADAPGGVVDMKKFPNSNNRLIRFDASLRGTAAQPSASAS